MGYPPDHLERLKTVVQALGAFHCRQAVSALVTQLTLFFTLCECWAECDGLCIHLFRKTPFAHELAVDWSSRDVELVKRAGFTMMATLTVHDKAVGNEVFRGYLGRGSRYSRPPLPSDPIGTNR